MLERTDTVTPCKVAYCVKCRTRRDMKNPRQLINKRGVPMLQDDCEVCGRVINTFLKKEAADNLPMPAKLPAEPKPPRKKRKSFGDKFGELLNKKLKEIRGESQDKPQEESQSPPETSTDPPAPSAETE